MAKNKETNLTKKPDAETENCRDEFKENIKQFAIEKKLNPDDLKKMMKEMGIDQKDILDEYKPDYVNWLGRDGWNYLEAACVMNGLDPDETSIDNYSTYSCKLRLPLEFDFLEKELDMIKSWSFGLISMAQNYSIYPLQLINKYLLVGRVKNIPQELLQLAKEKFKQEYKIENNNLLFLKKDGVAPEFQEVINSIKQEQVKNAKGELSERKENTYLTLIGILVEKSFTATKYKNGDKPNLSAIVKTILEYVHEQCKSDSEPRGLGKSNIDEYLKKGLEEWSKVKQ